MRAAVKLIWWFAVVWTVAAQWEYGQTVALQLVRSVESQLGSGSVQSVFWSLTAVLAGAGFLAVPLFTLPVGLDRQTGRLRHPFGSVPLRIRLRVSRWRLLSALVGLNLAYLLTVQSLPQLLAGSGSAYLQFESTDWRYVAGYGAAVSAALVFVVGIACVVLARVALARSSASHGFVRYHVDHFPVFSFFWRVVVFAVYPLSVFAVLNLPHPWHLSLSAAWVVVLGVMVVAAQAVTLLREVYRDGWLMASGESLTPDDLALRAACAEFLAPRGLAFANEPSQLHPAGTPPHSFVAEEPPLPRSSMPGSPFPGATMGDDLAEIGMEEEELDSELEEANFLASEEDDTEEFAGDRWRAVRRVAAVGGVFTVLLGLGVLWQMWILPSGEETLELARAAHIHVRKTGSGDSPQIRLLGTRYDYSLNTSLDNISEHFVNAVVASEDHRFYEHGAAYKLAKFAEAGVLCAFLKVNIFSSTRACAGNSTIGQQLARNLLLSEKRSITRKVKELLWAIKMEMSLSKETILELYLNRLYLGRGNFGVELASRSYFSKSADKLSVYEAALLAAAVKRPGWNWRDDQAGALRRARLILALMRRHGYAPPQARFSPGFAPRMGKRPPRKPYLGHLWQWLQPDITNALSGLPDGDYKLLTSLNAEVEIYAERHLGAEVKRLRRGGVPVSQGAVVVMRSDGRVLAMVGGVGSDVTARGLNRAKRTRGLHARPPASSFKPFVYLAALEKGLTPDSTIDASPVDIPMPAPQQPYRPRNYDGQVYSDITLRQGLVRSINTAAVNLLHKRVGFDRLYDVLARLGVDTSSFSRQWGMALGASTVPLIEMTSAYAAFANGGVPVRARSLLAVTTAQGRIVWRAPAPSMSRKFRHRDIAYINEMLQAVVTQGTGTRARTQLPSGLAMGGKTGTGDGFVDAWFVGYTADVVIGVWMGNDRPRAMRDLYGGTGPAVVFNKIARDLVRFTTLIDTKRPLP